jgi:uncharacterized cupin superfamily protein
MSRPPFIIRAADVPERSHVYPNSDEAMAPSRPIGRHAGLLHLGLNLVRVLPGTRTSWPHAEEKEEEFAYVIEGECHAWIDGHLYPMRAGDLVAWPPGTGITHTILNNGERDALLLAGGHAGIASSRIYYPLNDSRRGDLPWSQWWSDVPARPLGPHDGVPDARRSPK